MRATNTLRFTTAITFTALAAGGCTSNDPGPPAASESPSIAAVSPTSSVNMADQAVRDEVLNRYRGFRSAYTQAGLTADAQNEDLLSYIETPLKQQVIAFLTQTKQHGAVYRGQAGSNPTVVEVDLAATTPTVLISDCYDATDYLLYYTKTGKPVPIKSGPRRYIIETTATKDSQRGWLFVKSQSYPERSC